MSNPKDTLGFPSQFVEQVQSFDLSHVRIWFADRYDGILGVVKTILETRSPADMAREAMGNSSDTSYQWPMPRLNDRRLIAIPDPDTFYVLPNFANRSPAVPAAMMFCRLYDFEKKQWNRPEPGSIAARILNRWEDKDSAEIDPAPEVEFLYLDPPVVRGGWKSVHFHDYLLPLVRGRMPLNVSEDLLRTLQRLKQNAS